MLPHLFLRMSLLLTACSYTILLYIYWTDRVCVCVCVCVHDEYGRLDKLTKKEETILSFTQLVILIVCVCVCVCVCVHACTHARTHACVCN